MQKRLVWTASSISKELRGLGANFWTKKELNLNYLDRGLKLKKPRGSLANIPGRTGIHGSRPPDLDLTIRTNPDPDLIPCVGYGSCGSEPTPATAAAELAGKPFPAAALHGNSPELADSCVPWAK